MTKKELIEMLSIVPDNAEIAVTNQQRNPFLLVDTVVNISPIKGFYEHNGTYILSGLNVRPNYISEND